MEAQDVVPDPTSGSPAEKPPRLALRQARRAARVTQAALAEQLGLHQSTLSRIEAGAGASKGAAMAIRTWLAEQGVETPLEEWLLPAEAGESAPAGGEE